MHSHLIYVKKLEMKAERWANEDRLRGTLLLRMATLGTLAKRRRSHPEGSLPSSLANRYFDCQKTKKEQGLSLPGKLPAPNNSRDFSLRLGAGVRSRD